MTTTDIPATDATDAPGEVELDDVLPGFRFSERHSRRVDLPLDRVWAAALAVTQREVRLLGPLFALRELPARLLRRGPTAAGRGDQTMLAAFADEGFVPLRVDAAEVAAGRGRGLAVYGAAGRFWSPTADAAVRFAGYDEFLAFAAPGYARLAATLEAVDRGDHTELVTETRVLGTDAAANRRFGPYWALIRLPSGLIRRSWLAAIARRAAARDS